MFVVVIRTCSLRVMVVLRGCCVCFVIAFVGFVYGVCLLCLCLRLRVWLCLCLRWSCDMLSWCCLCLVILVFATFSVVFVVTVLRWCCVCGVSVFEFALCCARVLFAM